MSPIRESITHHIYRRIFLTSSLTTFTLIGAGFIDSVIISHYLGSNAIAAAGLAYPFYSLAGIVHGCLATGFKSMASRSLTQGDTKGFQRIFSLCVTISAIVSIAAVVLLIVFAGPLSFLFGARGNSAELLNMTKSYLTGLSIGFPALVFNTLLSTSLQFDNGIDYIGKAHITGMVTDITLDLLAVNMGLGLFAIGLASSVSAYVSLAVLNLHFLSGNNSLRYIPVRPSADELSELVHLGSDRIYSRVLTFIRPLIINPIAIATGGTAAMAVLSVRNSIMSFIAIPGYGISDGVSVTADISYNMRSRSELIQTAQLAHLYTIVFGLIPGVIICIFSKPIASFLLPDASSEELRLLVFALCMAGAKLPLETILTARISYLQAIGSIDDAKRILFIFNFAAVIPCVSVMGFLLSSYGVMAAFTLADLLVMVSIFIYYARKEQSLHVTVDDYLHVEDECDISPGDIIDLGVRTHDECSLTAEQVRLFCRGHGANEEHSSYAASYTLWTLSSLLMIAKDIHSNISLDGYAIKICVTYREGKVRMHYRFLDSKLSAIDMAKQLRDLYQEKVEELIDKQVRLEYPIELKHFRSMDVENLIIIM